MATFEGNLQALDAAFARVAHQYETRQIQTPITRQTGMVFSREWPVNTAWSDWEYFDIRGYEILVDSAEAGATRGGQAWLRLGTEKPVSNSDLRATESDVIVVRPGDRLRVPQGFQGVWFLPDRGESIHGWRIQVIKLPLVTLDRQQAGEEAVRVLPAETAAASPDILTSSPLGTTAGGSIPYGTKKIAILVLGGAGAPLTEDQSLEIWWRSRIEGGGGWVWWHNGADDLDAAGRGQAGAAHNAELYEVPPSMGAVVAVRTSGASDGKIEIQPER